VDSNFDGIFETGVLIISGSEIRFKFNPSPLGTRPYAFMANQVDGFSFIHKLNNTTKGSTFKGSLSLTCFKLDSDFDGVYDSVDLDSDNDGLTDNAESFTTAPAGVVGANGLIADAETVDDYTDVNGLAFEAGSFGLLDTGNLVVTNGIDYDYRRIDAGTQLFGTRIISSLQNGTVVPNKIDAYLNIVSNNWGVVISRVAGTAAITSPVEGMLVFDTSDGTFKVCTQGGVTPIWRALEN
jgi:hypothetical protein